MASSDTYAYVISAAALLGVAYGATHGAPTPTEAINGQVDPRNPPGPLIIVNPAESTPTGWGAPSVQQFQSGHTNNQPTNESAEQGWGVGPERSWPHYPHATNPNPFRALNVLLRNGTDSYSTNVYRPEVVAYWAQALAYEQSSAPVKNRQRPGAVQNQAASTPYVATVPPLTPGGY